jgi:hypothetical protein
MGRSSFRTHGTVFLRTEDRSAGSCGATRHHSSLVDARATGITAANCSSRLTLGHSLVTDSLARDGRRGDQLVWRTRNMNLSGTDRHSPRVHGTSGCAIYTERFGGSSPSSPTSDSRATAHTWRRGVAHRGLPSDQPHDVRRYRGLPWSALSASDRPRLRRCPPQRRPPSAPEPRPVARLRRRTPAAGCGRRRQTPCTA